MADSAHFDADFVGLLARMHAGNGLAHLREQEELAVEERAGWSRHEMIAASSFAIAGSLWSLISPKEALKAQ